MSSGPASSMCLKSRRRSSRCESMLHGRPRPACRWRAHIPVARFNGKGGTFEAVGAEATNLVSQVALTFADDVGVEIRSAELRHPHGEAAGRPVDRHGANRDRSRDCPNPPRDSSRRRQGRWNGSTGAASPDRGAPGRRPGSRSGESNGTETTGFGSPSPRRRRSRTGMTIPFCGCATSRSTPRRSRRRAWSRLAGCAPRMRGLRVKRARWSSNDSPWTEWSRMQAAR